MVSCAIVTFLAIVSRQVKVPAKFLLLRLGKAFAFLWIGGPMAATILLIDDDRLSLKNVSAFLQDEGYVVKEASDGAQALKLLDKDRFDLVLSDVVMPRVDGLGVLAHLRSMSPQTPLVFMTGDGTITRSDALNRGATDCVLKPFELTELARRIAEALKKKRLRRYHSPPWQANHRSRSR
jgi:DNA-binding NtrC family response regulator